MDGKCDSNLARGLLARGEQLKSDLARIRMEAWRKLAGDEMQGMISSQATADSCLKSANPRIRRAAIQVLTFHWEPSETFVAACRAMASSDTDADVRVDALTSLGIIYAGTCARGIGALCASMVLNENLGGGRSQGTGRTTIMRPPSLASPNLTACHPD